jgi:hypothetical protein
MPQSGGKAFSQSYNCQAAVDEHAQVIIAAAVTQQPQDKRQLKPMVRAMKDNDCVPGKLSADADYFSAAQIEDDELESIDLYIATAKEKHGKAAASAARGRIPKGATTIERMTRKLRTLKGRCTDSKRKHIVEPVFGQIKDARGFRRFSLRGLENVQGEWSLVCLTHNMLKLFRSGWRAATV